MVNKIDFLLRVISFSIYPYFIVRPKEDTLIKDLLINNQIREKEVRLLDADGAQLGILSTYDARKLAEEKEMDLVLISPVANPPVCKIMDYGKYKFETLKKEKENRKNQKIVELKEIQLSTTIDVGDINTKAKHAIRFLSAGDRVKVAIKLRGRQMARPELAEKVMNEFFEMLKEYCQIDKRPVLEGKNMSMILNPLVKKV